MFQLYLLTVLSTILAGLTLSGDFLAGRFKRFSPYMAFMDNRLYRVILGVLSFFVGFLNLFKSSPSDIVIIGDLLPSLGGMITGFLLIVKLINSRDKEGSKIKEKDEDKIEEKDEDKIKVKITEKLERFTEPYWAVIGVTTVVIGFLHAIAPKTFLI